MVDLPNSTSFISSLEHSRPPFTGLVLRGSHNYLEDRQSRNTSTNDADIHGVSADHPSVSPYAGVIGSRVRFRRARWVVRESPSMKPEATNNLPI